MYISYAPCPVFSDAAFQQPASKGGKKTAKWKNAYIVKKKKNLNGISNKSIYFFLKKKKNGAMEEDK